MPANRLISDRNKRPRSYPCGRSGSLFRTFYLSSFKADSASDE